MRVLVFTLLTLVWAVPCFAQSETLELPSDSRIKWLAYNETDIYTITTKYGYQTSIVFANNEEIDTISVGDRSLWQIIPSGHRLFIRPMQEGVATNMTLLTNKRSYQFDLKSMAAEEKEGNNIYVAKFIYPGSKEWNEYYAPASVPPIAPPAVPTVSDKPVTSAPSTTPEVPPTTDAPPAVNNPPVAPPQAAVSTPAATVQPIYPNYNYTYSGPDTMAPLQVFDNGKTTFIKYHTLPQPLPEVFLADTIGNRELVKPEIQDNMLVLGTVAGTWVLKQGNSAITIYNEMLNPEKSL